MPAQGQRTQLRNILVEYFDEEELRTFCFDLGVRYDDLGGRSKADKARELVDFMDRKGRLAEVVAEGRKQRPNASWPELDESEVGERGGPRFPINHIPFHRNLSFTGRDDLLEEMRWAWPFDPYDMATWEESGRLLPHLLAVVNLAADYVVQTQTVAYLNNTLGFYLRYHGDLAGARPYYERALAITEKALGAEHPDTTRSLNNLAFLHYKEGDLAGAGRLMRRALAIREARLGAQHPDTVSSRESLALIVAALESASTEEE